LPADDIGQVRFLDHPAVELSQQVLHQDLDGKGQFFNGCPGVGGKLIEIKKGDGFSIDLERLRIIRVFHGKVLFGVEWNLKMIE
jgi:hypothetical protein